MQSLILPAFMGLLQPQVVELDLSYPPCRELYEKAVKSGVPADMHYVRHICAVMTPKTRSDE